MTERRTAQTSVFRPRACALHARVLGIAGPTGAKRVPASARVCSKSSQETASAIHHREQNDQNIRSRTNCWFAGACVQATMREQGHARIANLRQTGTLAYPHVGPGPRGRLGGGAPRGLGPEAGAWAVNLKP